jgi:uncharacterized repeat protein (TIGR02543 family)
MKKQLFRRKTVTLFRLGAITFALALAGCVSPTNSGMDDPLPDAAEFAQSLKDAGAVEVTAAGDTVTLSGAAQIPPGETLAVPENVRFVIASGAAFTLGDGAAVEVYGTLILEQSAAAAPAEVGTITVKAGGVSENGNPESAAAATWIYESGCAADVISAFTLPEGARIIATARENGASAYEFVPGDAVDPLVLKDPWTLGEGALLSIDGQFTIAAPLTIAKDATFAIGSKAAIALDTPAADVIFRPGCTIQVAKEANIEAPDTSLAAVEKGKENTVSEGGYIIAGKDLGDNFTPGSGNEDGPGEESFTVRFDSREGSPVADQSVASGGRAVEPNPAPAKEGHTLAGWYTEAECVNPWDFAVNTVSAALTLFAKWTPSFIPVTGIAGEPAAGSRGLAVDLTAATVEPANATKTAMRWTLVSAGGTGVTQEDLEDGSFTPAASGTVALTATVEDGEAAGKAFSTNINIVIAEGFIAVTGIAGVPETGTTGQPVSLNGAVVEPANAGYSAIVWTVADAGGTLVTNESISNGTFTPAHGGTLKLTGTIENGLAVGADFVREFTIVIDDPPEDDFVPVTGLANVPETGEARQALSLAAVTVLPPEANQTIQWSVVDPGATGLAAGAFSGSSITPPAFGTLKLRAAIAGGNADGSAYTRDITIPIAKSSNARLLTLTPSAGSILSMGGSDVYWEVPNVPFEVETISFTAATEDSGAATGSLGPFGPLTPGGYNTYTITVTAEDGVTTKTYHIQVTRAAQTFFPVTGIENVPATGKVNQTVSLAAATVSPANATNTTIVWSVVASTAAGVSPGDLTGNSFTPTGAGAVTVRAAIANGLAQGTPYVSGDFVITITALENAGTAEISVGFGYGTITIAGNDGANVIRKSGSPYELALSATGYESCKWYVGGAAEPAGSANSVTINAPDYAPGLYWVTFVGTRNGTAYSQRIPFTVAQ